MGAGMSVFGIEGFEEFTVPATTGQGVTRLQAFGPDGDGFAAGALAIVAGLAGVSVLGVAAEDGKATEGLAGEVNEGRHGSEAPPARRHAERCEPARQRSPGGGHSGFAGSRAQGGVGADGCQSSFGMR